MNNNPNPNNFDPRFGRPRTPNQPPNGQPRQMPPQYRPPTQNGQNGAGSRPQGQMHNGTPQNNVGRPNTGNMPPQSQRPQNQRPQNPGPQPQSRPTVTPKKAPPKKPLFKKAEDRQANPKPPKPRKPRYRKPLPLGGDRPKKFNLKPISARHSSLGALIALSVLFVSIVTAVGIGVYKQEKRTVVDSVPTFTYECVKLLADSALEPMPKVDMSDYADTLDAQLYSQSALMVDLSTGVVMMQKNPTDRVYPASLTKIMTALIAIEQLTDLEDTYMFTDEIFAYLAGQNASVAGFEAWETVTIRDLIYGVMLPSGAEASIAVAELIAGSETGFAAEMNKRAKELGMENTNFVNCTGLHDDDHYTTVTDIAILLDYALSNEFFHEVFTTRTYTTSRTKYHPSGMTFEATVFRYIRAEGFAKQNEFIIGGKTGFTLEGRQCLASIATDGEYEYILITTGAGEGTNKPYYNVMDAMYVYDLYLGS